MSNQPRTAPDLLSARPSWRAAPSRPAPEEASCAQEKEREVEDRVQGLTCSLRSAERHKRFLQRSNWLLSAAAAEAVLQQVRRMRLTVDCRD